MSFENLNVFTDEKRRGNKSNDLPNDILIKAISEVAPKFITNTNLRNTKDWIKKMVKERKDLLTMLQEQYKVTFRKVGRSPKDAKLIDRIRKVNTLLFNKDSKNNSTEKYYNP